VALEALATITHHGGLEIRAYIAAKTTLLLELLDEHLNNRLTTKLAWKAMSHSVCVIVQTEEESSPIHSLDIPRIIRPALYLMRQPAPDHPLANHFLCFLGGAAWWCSAAFFANPSSISFLLSCTRNADVRIRTEAVDNMLRLHTLRATPEVAAWDVQRFVDDPAAQHWPDHLVDVLMGYGIMYCDVT
jgi:hypothetical protein